MKHRVGFSAGEANVRGRGAEICDTVKLESLADVYHARPRVELIA
jgi:hypothetical protein